MPITPFGKSIRKARIDAEVTLVQMARDLEVSPSFLSGLECGTKNISSQWVSKIVQYFKSKNIKLDSILVDADISNGTVIISHLPSAQQRLTSIMGQTDTSRFFSDKGVDFNGLLDYIKEKFNAAC